VRTLIRFFVAATAVVAVTAGLAACKSPTPYAAKVNGVILSKTGLDNELSAIKNNDDYLKALSDSNVTVLGKGAGTFDTAFVARVLTRRIYLELIHQEVERLKLKVTEKDLDNAREELAASIGDPEVLDKFPKSYYEEIRRTTAEVQVLQAALAKVDTSDAGLAAYYAEHEDQFESVCAAHILVETKADADKIERQITAAKDKALTFADIAKKQSTDTGSGEKGGDLGCAAPAGYVAEFKDAVRTQKVGVVGDPVKSQFGYHIIRVDKREPAPPLDTVKEQVRQAVAGSGQSGFNDFLAKASTKAKVEVNPRYGKFDRSGDSPQVVPPETPDNAGTNTTIAGG